MKKAGDTVTRIMRLHKYGKLLSLTWDTEELPRLKRIDAIEDDKSTKLVKVLITILEEA